MVRKTSAALTKLRLKEHENVGVFAQNIPAWTISDLRIMYTKGISVTTYATNTGNQAKYIIDEAEIRFLIIGKVDQYSKALGIYAHDHYTLQKIIALNKRVRVDDTFAIHFDDLLELKRDISIRQTIQLLIKLQNPIHPDNLFLQNRSLYQNW